MAVKVENPDYIPSVWKEFNNTFTIREIIGEERYTEIMCQLYGYKYEKAYPKQYKAKWEKATN